MVLGKWKRKERPEKGRGWPNFGFTGKGGYSKITLRKQKGGERTGSETFILGGGKGVGASWNNKRKRNRDTTFGEKNHGCKCGGKKKMKGIKASWKKRKRYQRGVFPKNQKKGRSKKKSLLKEKLRKGTYAEKARWT